ncbi:MAG: putative porin [Bacteroidales bacterium]|jgi:hypothetical protein|nr:putative porin [Bacteroidales bacterium]
MNFLKKNKSGTGIAVLTAAFYTVLLLMSCPLKSSAQTGKAHDIARDTAGMKIKEIILPKIDRKKYKKIKGYTKDEIVRLEKRDSVKNQKVFDSMQAKIDSLWKYGNDSIAVNMEDSLKFLQDSVYLNRKSYLTTKELRIIYRDSILNLKDSLIRITPRVLQTYVLPDSLMYMRMIIWTADNYFNHNTHVRPDTAFNSQFYELPYLKKDLGVTYLGTSGSPMVFYNYFKRKKQEDFPFYTPYVSYTYSPSTIPFYNVKTPYTELAYRGTLLGNKEKEEDNLHILQTQNLTPSFNFAVMYERFGSRGMLLHESTDHRTFSLTGNYMGKRYVAEGGYIFSRVKRDENGGISDMSMILDTVIDVRTIPVTLSDASNELKNNTLFYTQSYRLPLSMIKKGSDSLGTGKGTNAFIGHAFEYSTHTKSYTDKIEANDTTGRTLYHDKFYINPTSTKDSARVMKIENKFFLRLQPWDKNAIVSKVSAGIGHQFMNYYVFSPNYFLTGNRNITKNNIYLYFGASGQFRNYFHWQGFGKFDFAGYYKNDFEIKAKADFNSSAIGEGIRLETKFSTSLKKPDYFYNHYYSNHYIWNGSLKKTSETRIEATLNIPKYKFGAYFGYALLNNNIYLDSLCNVKQYGTAMNVMTASVRKDFRIWNFHLENSAMLQLSSNKDAVSVPKFSLHARYYIQGKLVKNVLTAQLGADITYCGKYYMQAYSPALGMFYSQTKEKQGGSPYIDAFINLQWKRACIFVKVVNVAQNWPRKDYFSAYRYIKSQRALKIGIYWPFYTH